jgi:hypothetical protein
MPIPDLELTLLSALAYSSSQKLATHISAKAQPQAFVPAVHNL